MNDILNNKINDYCAYVVQAVKNFRNKHYGDSAANCRKAAEAACKILFFHAYPQKVAEGKTANKSLKELIFQVIKDNVAERKVINNLETLQITGNKAAHDNLITQKEAGYALNALDLLTQYLFSEKLKIQIPSSLNFDEEKKEPQIKTEVIEKIVIKESRDPEKEEAWQKKLDLIEKQNEDFQNQLNENKKELKHYGVAQPVQNITAESAPEITIPSGKSPGGKTRLFIVIGAITLCLIVIFFFYLKLVNKESSMDTPVVRLGDTIYVALNKFQVLQDNPNMDFKIESILQSWIKKKAAPFSLPIKCISTDFKVDDLNSDTTIWLKANRLGYDLAYWGNLYESSLADSNILEIKGCITRSRNFFRNKKIKFKNLLDSLFIKEINDQANSPVYAYCVKQERKKDFKKLVKIISGLHSFSDENFLAMGDKRSVYLNFSGQPDSAIILLKKMIQIVPDGMFYDRLANIYGNIHQFDSASATFKKGYEHDSLDAQLLLNYGIFNLMIRKNGEGLNLLQRVLKIDPNNKRALELILLVKKLKKGGFLITDDYKKVEEKAENYLNTGQYAEALKVYLKSSDVINNSAIRNTQIAKCYIHLGDTVNTLKYYYKAYEMDSMDENTVLFAALFSENLKPLSRNIDYYYKRALRLYPDNLLLLERSSDYYIRTKHFKECIEVGLLAEKKYPTHRSILRNTALAALMAKNCFLAVTKHETLNLMYPSDTNMAYLAQAYLTCSNNDPKSPEFLKGAKLIHKAYLLNPKNTITGGVYQRYREATIIGLAEPQAFTPKDIQKQNAALRYKNSLRTPVVLYSDKTTTITSNGQNNTITKRFSNGSESGLTHSMEGGTSHPTHFFKGQGPPKDAVLPAGKEMFSLILNNKKLSKKAKLDFLKVELEYYNKNRRRIRPPKDVEMNKLIAYIEKLMGDVKRLKK